MRVNILFQGLVGKLRYWAVSSRIVKGLWKVTKALSLFSFSFARMHIDFSSLAFGDFFFSLPDWLVHFTQIFRVIDLKMWITSERLYSINEFFCWPFNVVTTCTITVFMKWKYLLMKVKLAKKVWKNSWV